MTLDEEYQKTIDDQRTHLLKLQEDFNKECDKAKERATSKLKKVPEDDRDAREAILKEQKAELQVALHQLKMDVDHSTRQTMKELERIVREKEKLILTELEEEMKSLKGAKMLV